jgi:hypothetical protein
MPMSKAAIEECVRKDIVGVLDDKNIQITGLTDTFDKDLNFDRIQFFNLLGYFQSAINSDQKLKPITNMKPMNYADPALPHDEENQPFRDAHLKKSINLLIRDTAAILIEIQQAGGA